MDEKDQDRALAVIGALAPKTPEKLPVFVDVEGKKWTIPGAIGAISLFLCLTLAACAPFAQGVKDGAAAAALDKPPQIIYVPVQPTNTPAEKSPGTWDYIGYALASLAAYACGSVAKGGIRSVIQKGKGVA